MVEEKKQVKKQEKVKQKKNKGGKTAKKDDEPEVKKITVGPTEVVRKFDEFYEQYE